jgi:hypothetical protein
MSCSSRVLLTGIVYTVSFDSLHSTEKESKRQLLSLGGKQALNSNLRDDLVHTKCL